MECPINLLDEPKISKLLRFLKGTPYLDVRQRLKEEYITLLDEYYNKQEIPAEVGFQTFFLPSELIKNAYYHGRGNNHDVDFGIFLSPLIVVVGCNDGGDYFKDLRIKEVWEKKLPIPSEGIIQDENGKFSSGANLGINYIYSFTDKIFIDEKSGTFFGKFDPTLYAQPYDKIIEMLDKRREPVS
jgi:hypothetical protein